MVQDQRWKRRAFGWLSDMPGAQQSNGFFIDEFNRILYWPSKATPGYIVDTDTASEIIALLKKSPAWSYIFIVPVIMVWPLSQWLGQKYYHQLDQLFSTEGLFIGIISSVLLASLMVMGVAQSIYNSTSKKFALQQLLAGREQISTPRPKAQTLKPSERGGNTPTKYWLACDAIVLAGFLFLYFSIPPNVFLGDAIIRTIYGLLCLGFGSFMIRLERKGMRVKDIRFYEHPVQDTSKQTANDDVNQIPLHPSFVSKVFKWLFEGWGFWVVGIPTVILLTIGFLKLMEQPITADELAANFMHAAFGSNPSPDDTFIVQKWDHNITAFVTPNGGRLADRTAEVLKRFEKYTSMSIKRTNDATDANISFHFHEGDTVPAYGRNDKQPGVLTKTLEKEKLKKFELYYDMKRLHDNLDYSYFANSKALGKLYDKKADFLVQRALGLAGPYQDSPNDKTDSDGNRLYFPNTYIAMYYDHRILARAPQSELQAIALRIADEIMKAPSFDDWLAHSNTDPGHKAVFEGRYADAFNLFMSDGDLQDSITQYRIGWLYEMGQGVKQNFIEAAAWYRKSAEGGYVLAQHELGRLLFSGKTGAPNKAEAITLYQRAADSNLSIAHSNLCHIYFTGDGAAKDLPKAFKHCQLGAQYGHSPAQKNMGLFYLRGTHVERSDEQACIWFQRAAKRNDPVALYLTGECYRTGRGVPKNKMKAYEFYKKAAQLKVKAALSRLKSIKWDDPDSKAKP